MATNYNSFNSKKNHLAQLSQKHGYKSGHSIRIFFLLSLATVEPESGGFDAPLTGSLPSRLDLVLLGVLGPRFAVLGRAIVELLYQNVRQVVHVLQHVVIAAFGRLCRGYCRHRCAVYRRFCGR